jgi:CRP/FNR family transcriptional regulator
LIENLELARLLELYPIFHELPPGLKHSFRASCYTVHLNADDLVFDANRPIHFFFFLTSGSIRVVYMGLDREILLYRVQPGEICILSVGQILSCLPFQVIAYSEQQATIVAIPDKLLTQLVEASPLFSLYLFDCYSRRLSDLLALVEAVSFGRLDQRLAGLLLSKGILVQTTHVQLANELGTVREVISRLLKEFENKGLVKLKRGTVSILDQQELEKIATYSNNSNP